MVARTVTTFSEARSIGNRLLLGVGVPFFLVACVMTYYGQFHRTQSGDVYGTIYESVAVVDSQTIWLDDYQKYIQQHSGERPYMLTTGTGGHVVNATPFASSVLALPVVAVFSLAGANPDDWHYWMEAAMLTAALTTAAAVAVMFVLLTRLTTRRRAALITATFAWGTMAWGIDGQALWQHGGATLALVLALLALVDRRPALAGAAIGAMVCFRLTTPVIAVCLLPLLGRNIMAWARFALGGAAFAVALGLYNQLVFGSPFAQGYGTAHVASSVDVGSGRTFDGIPGLLVSPGRGLLVYSPVLIFAVVGAIRGRRTPLYRWCTVAAIAFIVTVGNSEQWWGGESFGPRKLAEVLPLLVVLLVPAVDWIAGTRAAWIYFGLLAWSVFVQLLAAASSWPPGGWYDTHDLTARGTWWEPFDNEISSLIVGIPHQAARLTAMLGLMAAALALGLLASRIEVPQRRRQRSP